MKLKSPGPLSREGGKEQGDYFFSGVVADRLIPKADAKNEGLQKGNKKEMSKGTSFCFERVEKKYMLTRSLQEAVLITCSEFMKPDAYSNYQINNIYYDTDNWQLIRASLDKPVYKEKIRVRSYGVPNDQDEVFVELKRKCGDVVYKRRITVPAEQVQEYMTGVADYVADCQIRREIDWFQQFYCLVPKVFISYRRQAFSGLEDPELRITFDTDFRWRGYDLDLRAGDHGEHLVSDDNVLMEVKIPGTAPLWLSRLLSTNGIFSSSFSKYGYCYKTKLFNNSMKGNVQNV